MHKKLRICTGLFISLAILTACNSGGGSSGGNNGGGGGGGSTGLSSYPTAGNYIGTATSSKGWGVATATGTISGSTGNFTVATNTGTGTIQGVFQLNNNTCFVGSETLGNSSFPVTKSFVATNCTYNGSVFNANYQTGFGDEGTLTMTLQ